MARAIWAFLAFNVYSLLVLFAFEQNTLYLFDTKLLSDLASTVDQFGVNEWEWRDHYLWRLLATVIATGVGAFIAGAIARKGGGKVALVANIPSILFWVWMFWYAVSSPAETIMGQTGFMIISLIAIPLTSFVAYSLGNFGALIQETDFHSDTVLGIWPFHWVWLVIPLDVYFTCIVFVIARFVWIQLLTFRDYSIIGSIIGLIALIPVVAWVLPLKFTYDILAGESLAKKSVPVLIAANATILVGGFVIALGIQIGCYWLLQTIASWWY